MTEEYFYRRAERPSGFASWCKECKSAAVKKRREENLDASLAAEAAFRRKYSEKKAATTKLRRANDAEWRERDRSAKRRWASENREKAYAASEKWRSANRDRRNERARERYTVKKDEILLKRRTLRAEDPDWADKDRKSLRDWRAANPERARASYKRANAAGKARNPLRYSVSYAVKNALAEVGLNKSGFGVETLLGYKISALKEHLERQFDRRMTWENHGEYWEVDHIIPLASFNIASPTDAEFKAAWAMTNLRPLEKHKNRSKGARREHLI